ncbi:unnamed protein product [Rotaria sp. Silwood2]|nr:unnamed protein product [Rotaria sp. Silwood2]CAF2962063.1 unnamed protein product [Rotaria sp. Silwood2]CAF3349287.1 unnamed protein product [Rotaria sp. Silwood2]CAF3418916.1 unnamed protein product [Rotaria sp. Silwood2]
MEESISQDDELDFICGSNIQVDFSHANKFNKSFEQLIKEVNYTEEKLAIHPRTSPVTPIINPSEITTSNPTTREFNTILSHFKTWIEENRHHLKRYNRKQSAELISQLIEALKKDNNLFDDESTEELPQQLLFSTSKDENQNFTRLINSSVRSNYPLIKCLICVMGLWAVKVIFQKN